MNNRSGAINIIPMPFDPISGSKHSMSFFQHIRSHEISTVSSFFINAASSSSSSSSSSFILKNFITDFFQGPLVIISISVIKANRLDQKTIAARSLVITPYKSVMMAMRIFRRITTSMKKKMQNNTRARLLQ